MDKLEDTAREFEEAKQKHFEEKNTNREEIDILEQRIQDMREKVAHQHFISELISFS